MPGRIDHRCILPEFCVSGKAFGHFRTLSDRMRMARTALTVLGKVDEPGPGERESLASAFTQRFPALSGFIADPHCALLGIHVRRYILVERFQQVREWIPG